MTERAFGRRRSRWLAGAASAGVVALGGYARQALSGDGAVAAAVLGAWVFGRGGLPAAGSLVAFFVSSSALSRFKQRAKARRGVLAQAKGGRRDAWQVLANGGVAGTWLMGSRGAGGYLGALATAGADTWATELGLLAPYPPRLVTTLRQVAPGTSGGVTPQGLCAASGGALLVGATWAVLDCGMTPGAATRIAALATLVGVAGSLLDSLLGATVQASYRCTACGAACETPTHGSCGSLAEHVRGWRWVGNDVVNGLSTLGGSVLGWLAWRAAGGRVGHDTM